MTAPLETAARILDGDRRALARLLTQIENGHDGIEEAVAALFVHAGRAYTVGITGAPGCGKSTLTDGLIAALRARGLIVGVLAVDPTSAFTGGALLGDRIRMSQHVEDRGVFIRSMANRGHLGGLALAVPQAARALDAFGADWTLIETVGVGQVELEVAAETDTTVVVVTPGAGDHVQVSKAGLNEIADVYVVNKCDRPGAKQIARDLRTEINLAPTSKSWRPPIVLAAAAREEGIQDVLDAIENHREHLQTTGELTERHRDRVVAELWTGARALALARLDRELVGDRFDEILERVLAREIDPSTAAKSIVSSLQSAP